MSGIPDSTPVIVGVGEASERIDAPDYAALSPADLAGRAAAAALADALPDDAAGPLARSIDLVAAIRQFEISGPGATPPFGASDNFPRSVAARIGADPARAMLEVVGGQGPQRLVNEMAHAIAAGEVGMALLAGAEAISTVRHLAGKGEAPNWSESVGGQLEDRGYGLEGLLSRDLAGHGARTPALVYALCENARRGKTGLGRDAYRLEMGRLFAPFTEAAAANPHAMSRETRTAQSLAAVAPDNRLIADPYTRRLVARDQANQGAAVLMTSLGRARALGIAPNRVVFLHGGADVKERTVVDRGDLGASPAAVLACRAALGAASMTIDGIDLFDLYSCFPIAVFNILDGLEIARDESRPLTLTGGLPFFGGAGNNYAMHAIASVVRALRAAPSRAGLIGANGGFLSKYSVGVYSAAPRPFRPFNSAPVQRQIDAWPAPPRRQDHAGEATIETYTIDYSARPPRAIVIARTEAGERLVAAAEGTIADRMAVEEPLAARIAVVPEPGGQSRVTTFAPAGARP